MISQIQLPLLLLTLAPTTDPVSLLCALNKVVNSALNKVVKPISINLVYAYRLTLT